ncbi:30S ribosomal protein S11 [Limisalsivibrio acetivorans]|uniref:30S ribosomal protein S11 n=1 Tax=Limisalsivibrio acetivorans TaxID=1304888 RepID=UPI0003B34F8E|nr:30S ribosomal protein S11 [Limisalsivibrio acetivorans]
MAKARRSNKRREKKNVPKGIAHISSTFNNTVITFTDLNGNALCWSAGGCVGFKNSRKSTPFAAQLSSEAAAKKALDNGMREVEVNVKGPGSGRESAIRAIVAAGIKITLIRDVTPVPHNGCRPRKKRRV